MPLNYKNLLIRATPGLHEKILRIISENCSKGTVLDWGAGQGALSQRLVDEGYKVTAVDMSSEFAAEGVAYHRIDFHDDLAVKKFIEVHSGSFDVVIGIEVIEHVENPWSYVRQLRDLVRAGGHIIVSTPNPSSWHSRLKFLLDGTYDEFNECAQEGHINPITPWEMRLIMTRIGLQEISISSAGEIYQGRRKSSHFFIELISKLIRIFQSGYLDGYCYVAISRKAD